MAERVDIPDIERVTFFTGQRLTEKDLAALQRANRELRWLHNRSLHSWGIGIGLAVAGERGDSAVTVEPGYGVDCLGREIILTAPRTMPVPAVAHGPGGEEAVYYLVAAYQEDADQKVAERRPGVCLPEGTVRLSEEPRLEWRRPEQLQEGFELVLGAGLDTKLPAEPSALLGRSTFCPPFPTALHRCRADGSGKNGLDPVGRQRSNRWCPDPCGHLGRPLPDHATLHRTRCG